MAVKLLLPLELTVEEQYVFHQIEQELNTLQATGAVPGVSTVGSLQAQVLSLQTTVTSLVAVLKQAKIIV